MARFYVWKTVYFPRIVVLRPPAVLAHSHVQVPAGAIKMAYWLGECPPGAHCPNKATSLADGKAAFTVFEVSAQQMTITHIASDGEVLYKAPPVKPRTPGQKPGLW